jgi:hypothetical protein
MLPRLIGKGHAITCHRMHTEGEKLYLHSFLTWALDGRGWSTPLPGKKPQDMSPDAPPVRFGRAWRTKYLLHPPRFEPRTGKSVASGQQFKVTWFISANNIFFLVFLLLGDSPTPEFYMPTFLNNLFHLHRRCKCILPYTTYEHGSECSETSTHEIQTPRSHPMPRIQHSDHGESLKSRI